MKCFLMYWMWTVLFIIPGLIDNSIGVVAVNSNEADLKGPVFTNEPLNRIDFSNSTGAVVECRASGNPPPEIIWIRSDSGTAVGDVPGLRQVLSNGNLVFPPFRAEDYRQEVHAQVYACMAKNSIGSIISRDVHVRAAIIQYYDTDVIKEFAIRGNSVVMKCQIPSFVQDFVNVVSWHTDQNETFYPGREIVVTQYYEADVNKEHVIRGNSAIIKCLIPSFVADFVEVVSWHTDQDETFSPNTNYAVVQYYDIDIPKEFAIRGNAAIMKCQIPSFVADFVNVISWHTDQDETFTIGSNTVVSQHYDTDGSKEYVIRGNSAIIKCQIPSFVADFVSVVSWHTDQDETFYPDNKYAVAQHYDTDVHKVYVIRGNSAILKCEVPSYIADFVSQNYDSEVNNVYVIRKNSAILKCSIPSFVADFVTVESWHDDEGGNYYMDIAKVVNQYYEAEVLSEYVIRGNAAVLKCNIPSFVADFVRVEAWLGDDGSVYNLTKNNFVVSQYYLSEAENEYVIRGNSVVLKCKIPSFVADFVTVEAWLDEDGNEFNNSVNGDIIVIQAYEAEADNEYIIRGNSAIMKCEIPSFVADFVFVDSWEDSEGKTYLYNNMSYSVVHQFYEVRVIDEFVLRGNSVILKCLLPSFVTEFVEVEAWLTSEGEEFKANDNNLVVNQYFEAQVYDVFVIRGNSAIFKCQIPSFVTDHVEIVSWQDTEGGLYNATSNGSLATVVAQAYSVSIMDEHVLRGNTAILKCHIPSFVSDFVAVDAWIDDEGVEYYPNKHFEFQFSCGQNLIR
uniref:CSON015509 protein n=1 Tax=Culicoides sonorensis TaxID=179676 RepID=A0A336LNV3_CULSO